MSRAASAATMRRYFALLTVRASARNASRDVAPTRGAGARRRGGSPPTRAGGLCSRQAPSTSRRYWRAKGREVEVVVRRARQQVVEHVAVSSEEWQPARAW